MATEAAFTLEPTGAEDQALLEEVPGITLGGWPGSSDCHRIRPGLLSQSSAGAISRAAAWRKRTVQGAQLDRALEQALELVSGSLAGLRPEAVLALLDAQGSAGLGSRQPDPLARGRLSCTHPSTINKSSEQ